MERSDPARAEPHDAVGCALDVLETPLAFASFDGTIKRANRAFRSWTASESCDLATVFGVALPTLLAQVGAGNRHTIKGTAKNDRGRTIPVEYQLRRVQVDGGDAVVVEGRDLSRVHEKEAMMQSFSKTIEVNNRLLNHQKAEIAKLLDEMNGAFAAVQRLLDSVDQGFVTLDRLGHVMAGRSAVFDRWFGSPAVGTKFADCLSRVSAATATMFDLSWSQLDAAALPLALLLDQLPARMQAAGRYFDIRYKPELDSVGELVNLLVVISDITDEVERGRAEAHQKDLLNLMARFASDRDGFREFLREAEALVACITASPVDDVTELLRAVHTLKGNCALFGAQVVANHCHEFESRIAYLGEVSDIDRRLLGNVWRGLRERVAVFLDQDDNVVSIAREEFEDVRRRARTMSSEALVQLLDTWTWEPTAKRLTRVGEQIRTLASRLGKAPVRIEVEDGGLRFDCDYWSTFWSSLAHVVRNIADHGIETLDARVARGKAEHARVILRTYVLHDRAIIELAEDGRGIDWALVATTAKTRGLDASSKEALIRALLTDGFSTRAEIDELSGRGVGLAVVRAACVQLSGTIEIESDPGTGTLFRFLFPLSGVSATRDSVAASPSSAA